MLCPNCNYDNKSTNIRCEKCGEQLIAESQIQDTNLNSSFNTIQYHVQDAKIKSFVEIFGGIVITIGGAIFCGVLSKFLFKGADIITKIVGIPFQICGIAILIYGISMIKKGINTKKNTNDHVNGKLDIGKVEESEKGFEKISNFVNNIYIFGFLLFWFGFLIVLDTQVIKIWSKGGNQIFFISLIFWAAGIYILLTKFRKNK